MPPAAIVEHADASSSGGAGCRRAGEARWTWSSGRPGLASVIARIGPLVGWIAASAAAGSLEYGSVRLSALGASLCSRGSIVVYTRSPPLRTVFDPYCF